MKLLKSTACQRFDIQKIRWKQRVIGLAVYRVSDHNEIHIHEKSNKDGTLYFPDTYYVSGKVARSCEVQHLPSGVDLYLVPMNKMEILERI